MGENNKTQTTINKMEKDLKKLGGFKLNDLFEIWINNYEGLDKIGLDSKNKKNVAIPASEISDGLFKRLNYLGKYNEILDFITNFKAIEFKGDNIEDDFSLFNELDEKIEAKVNVIKEMLEEFKEIISTLSDQKDVEWLNVVRENHYRKQNIPDDICARFC